MSSDGVPPGINRDHWHRRDAILVAHKVIQESRSGTTPNFAVIRKAVLEFARFIYYGDLPAQTNAEPEAGIRLCKETTSPTDSPLAGSSSSKG